MLFRANDECVDGGGGNASASAAHALQLQGSLAVTYDASGLVCDLRRLGPPTTALAYDGRSRPTMVVKRKGSTHIFAIGDWGGMDGSFKPRENRSRIIAYPGGHAPGPQVFPRTRWNKGHSKLLCNKAEFEDCFKTQGASCVAGCAWTKGIDTRPQYLVANAFYARAALKGPKYVLNIGDNFYWGGIEKTCGIPMSELSAAAKHQFGAIFDGMYAGGAPWPSALGNHDWGSCRFDNGWDQQIASTWKSASWVMPASYFKQTANYLDQGFSVDIFILDSNSEDFKNPGDDPEHNIWGATHNIPGASCEVAGGPASLEECKDWCHGRWEAQQVWLSKNLAASSADWKIVVSRIPCGVDGDWCSSLHKEYGMDLLVTGPRHDEGLWLASRMGGLTCFVTGGGGGITSEANPMYKSEWYGEAQHGFYDLTITEDGIFIESINFDGAVVVNATVLPKAAR